MGSYIVCSFVMQFERIKASLWAVEKHAGDAGWALTGTGKVSTWEGKVNIPAPTVRAFQSVQIRP
jgi:hypothetical protein